MAFLGWLAGRSIYTWIAAFDHWVVLLLLGWVGTRMIISGFDPESGTYCKDPTRGGTLLILCVATSIDALAVGLSFAMLQVDILFASVAIGLITFFLSMGGGLSGRFLGLKFGKRMEVVGGLILIGIGLRIIISHTWITG
jgi:putative Mn2+ efflux pump MntP